MYDVAIQLAHEPGALAALGEALGKAGISIEGGGAFTVEGKGVAHFLFQDGSAAAAALDAAGITVIACRLVIVLKLLREVPGQLGALTRMMADAAVNIEVLYSDHANQLVLVVDDYEAGNRAAEQWKAGINR
jgi:hypothetical protein